MGQRVKLSERNSEMEGDRDGCVGVETHSIAKSPGAIKTH